MRSSTDPRTLRALVAARRATYLADLQALVECESPSADIPRVERCLDWVERRLASDGWTAQREALPGAAGVLIARAAQSRVGPSTLLLAHVDTVWPVGTTRTMPFRVDDGRAFGPGVYDMKAGLVAVVHAMAVASETVGVSGPVTVLVNGDEETGSIASRPIIEREAARHDRVFVLEPATSSGAIVTARKGAGDFQVELRGRRAHSGEAFDDGINALSALADLIGFIDGLTDRALGTTVAVTVARGGTVSNVIPGEAHAAIDLRIERPDEGERVIQALAGYAPKDPRVRCVLRGGLKRPPMQLEGASVSVAEHVVALAAHMGMEIAVGRSGGGSDANFCSALGVPTVDGLGAVGAGAHAPDEHIDIAASLDRVALLAALLVVSDTRAHTP